MSGSFTDFIPAPLHPAVVHLPIALAILVPFFAIGAFFAVRRGAEPLRSWSIAVAMFAALTGSALVSKDTGEDQEDRVERVVPAAAFEAHEEAADAFTALSLAVLAVAALGLFNGRVGTPARGVATIGSLALLIAAYRVGHSGGALVYTHGAASAYVATSAPTVTDGALVPADRVEGARFRARVDTDTDDDRDDKR